MIGLYRFLLTGDKLQDMPHMRSRYAEPRLRHLLTAGPIVGILGHRQVGKTTLIESASSEYVTFDRELVLGQAIRESEIFIQNRKHPFAIDEAQLCPPLFPTLKEHVRINKKPGQFILSGSVRFTSRKAIRESLTGRILISEILPFSCREALSLPLSQLQQDLMKARNETDIQRCLGQKQQRSDYFFKYLEFGGLPGICFARDSSVRSDRWQTHLDTILNRDYRLIHPTTLPYDALREALAYLARIQGHPLELRDMAQKTRISTITLKKLLFAFEALFLIRRLSVEGSEKKVSYFLEDQGMATFLKPENTSWEPEYEITRGLYANLRHEFHYRPSLKGRAFQFRTRNGVNVPLVFSWDGGIIGFVPTLDATPRDKTLGTVGSFLKRFPKAKCVLAYGGKDIVVKSENHFWIPFYRLI